VSYAVLLGLVLTGLLGYLAMSPIPSTTEPDCDSGDHFLALQMILTISMILKRIRALLPGVQCGWAGADTVARKWPFAFQNVQTYAFSHASILDLPRNDDRDVDPNSDFLLVSDTAKSTP